MSLVVNLALHKNTVFGRTTLVGKKNNNRHFASQVTVLQLSDLVGSESDAAGKPSLPARAPQAHQGEGLPPVPSTDRQKPDFL